MKPILRYQIKCNEDIISSFDNVHDVFWELYHSDNKLINEGKCIIWDSEENVEI